MTYETTGIKFRYGRFTEYRKLFVPLAKLLSFDYVRETTYHTDSRGALSKRNTVKRPLFGEQHGGIIAYVCVGRDSPYYFKNLVWWHKHHDRDVQPDGVYKMSEPMRSNPQFKHWGPCEAVPPSRVLEFFQEFRGI
jgi:hypothetical protein